MASNSKQPILLPYQRRWLQDRSRRKIWLASRQVGKSFAIAMEAVTEALRSRCNNLILSSSERQSREVMHKVLMHMRYMGAHSVGVVGIARERQEEVTLHNGSRILSLAANPDTARGFSGNVYLDEFAFHTDAGAIWRAMYPAISRGYKVRVASTPNGKGGMFHRLWEQADGFSHHKVDVHDAVAEGLKVDIEQLRQGVADPEAWAQEFMCQFVDESTAWLPFDEITACQNDEAGADGQISPAGGEYYMGVDVGRRHDLSVFWAFEKTGDVFWSRSLKVMRDATFSAQREYLYSLLKRPGLVRCAMDASGLGTQLAEEAAAEFGPRVEPVTFTPQIKELMACTVKRHFQERTIRVPRDSAIREDLHSVRRTVTASGNVRFAAGRAHGSHADRFWALALALRAGGARAGAAVRYEAVKRRDFAGPGCW